MYKQSWYEYTFRCDWCYVCKIAEKASSLTQALYYLSKDHNWRVMDNKEYNKQNEYCNNCYNRIQKQIMIDY